MPLSDIHFQDGIFFCRQIGRIDEHDAQEWAEYAEKFTSYAHVPIVALVDATQATFVTAAARTILARASSLPNLHNAAIAVENFQVKNQARLTTLMARDKHTHIFDSIDEAQQFAYNRARLLRNHGSAGV